MLKIENIHVRFGKSVILSEVDLQIKEGEIVGLIGPNGCGKTTLLNTINGFVTAQDGSILFGDNDVTNLAPSARAKLGFSRSFQSAGIFKEMTVEENLLIPLETASKFPWWWKFSNQYKEKAERIVDEMLESVNLKAHKHSLAGILSGGQLRLLELLRLELTGGKLLLIDEPTAGVSPAMKKTLAHEIKKLAKAGRTVVLVEHDLKFLFELVSRVIVLVDGKVYMEGKPEEVSKDPKLQEVYFGK